MIKEINLLDEYTINKIAAGEVVERPSSVVKELVENSIDAKSSKITIEISNGGKDLIRITDNGHGIPKSQVEKSFLRHATSKISQIDDLYELDSLGFRGEALASIASIARVELITRTSEDTIGVKVCIEGGVVKSNEPIGTSIGTTIIVKDLFFNTPARKKFLKSSTSENINITDMINKLCIGNPDIQFKYINNNRIMLTSPGDSNLKNTVRSIYGKKISDNLKSINIETDFLKLVGYIGNNTIYRNNKTLQHIYINGRYVKSKLILAAIYEAYKGILPINKHSICFLNLSIDAQKIDVNVHPNKLEIKFEDDQRIFNLIKIKINELLLGTNLIPKYVVNNKEIKKEENVISIDDLIIDFDKEKIDPQKIGQNETQIKIDNVEEKIIGTIMKNKNNKNIDSVLDKLYIKNVDDSLGKVDISNDSVVKEDTINFKTNSDEVNHSEGLIKKENNDFIKPNPKETIKFDVEEVKESNEEISYEYPDEKLKDLNIVGTIFNTYIICQAKESIFLIDQHAAHERIVYEEYITKFKTQNISSQMLLKPMTMELSNKDMLIIEDKLDIFIKFGFEVELFGDNSIIVRSVPNVFGLPESENFILDIIDNIDKLSNNYDFKKEQIASMACKSAIKANDRIENIEINTLIEKLKRCNNSYTCPHGRPVIVEMTKKEIEKMFKRII
ncbi:DNA mismatch repair endonuclease MutL [Tepidibacter hydrothermalis]|uniref:DNA mismatch repair protein MutL n=1 Tax=Tepidibacter hydrothermalis TaxID=3036126 RepID=A0ABY8EGZ5_9FIRM|nr:DNA mismatch repair endonuclease MutL [Tepidibacter hydrothermalis]WFD12031.1 DNA mismatch repair endonuclease MutL [Tepidibacter hydrothermalis]